MSTTQERRNANQFPKVQGPIRWRVVECTSTHTVFAVHGPGQPERRYRVPNIPITSFTEARPLFDK